MVVEETLEGKALREIRSQSAEWLKSRQFEKLEQLAKEHRLSKACFPSGRWKLGEVYAGTVPKEEASEAEWKATLDELREWVESRPRSVTARVALANFLVSYAWKARGSDFAGKVTDLGWKLMGERLSDASHNLKEAETLEEKCPALWSVWSSVALGTGAAKPEFEGLFTQAVRFEPQYPAYYFNKAYYLLPRWYGGPHDTADFMMQAADRLGGDDGDLLYARMAYSLQTSVGGNVFDELNLSWGRVEKGLKVLDQRFSDSIQAKNLAAMMTLFGATNAQPVLARLDELHGKIDPEIWKSKERFLSLTKGFN